MDLTGRLTAWLFLVGALAALAYGSRATAGKPPRNAVYHWNLAIGGLVEYAVILGVVVAIAWGRGGHGRRLLALRSPISWRRALGLAVVAFFAIVIVARALDPLLHADREQGLTPSHWDPHRAGAFAANCVVIAGLAPIVEELTYRGLGYSLLERYGRTVAIGAVGLAFGLAHGLIQALPILVVFGVGLAWLRSRTQSVLPGVVVHAVFNALALTLSVTT